MSKEKQVYEKYWKYTAAWTDIHGNAFKESLNACIKYFIDHGVSEKYDDEDYKRLQESLCDTIGFGMQSARKAINQFVKLGFLRSFMRGLYPEAYEFIKAKDDSQRQVVLSKAVYNNANFQRSMTRTNDTWSGQMGFLIKTLEKCKSLTKNDMIAIMTYDYPVRGDKEYLNQEELKQLYEVASANGFIERKRNQIDHLMNLLNKLDNLRKRKGVIYFEEDAKSRFGDEDEVKQLSKYRDPYLQRLYKKQLIAECEGRCMVENVDYPVLIASHIRPYSDCRDKEDKQAAFDMNNGLLLSKNLDSLFDLGYITFNDDGSIIASKVLSPKLNNILNSLKLDPKYINDRRLEYMAFHRKYVFNKRFKQNSKQVTAI